MTFTHFLGGLWINEPHFGRLYIDKIENALAKYSTVGRYRFQLMKCTLAKSHLKKKKIWYPTFYFPSTSYQNGIHSYNFKAKSLYNSLLKVHLNSFWTIFLTTCCQCSQYVQNLIMSLPVL